MLTYVQHQIPPVRPVAFRTGSTSVHLRWHAADERGLISNFGRSVYLDAAGHSRSAIAVLASPDGVVWTEVCPAPVLAPHGTGWEAALVYAFDTARTGDTLRLYFNARDGWVDGVERIGLAQLSLPVTATDRNP